MNNLFVSERLPGIALTSRNNILEFHQEKLAFPLEIHGKTQNKCLLSKTRLKVSESYNENFPRTFLSFVFFYHIKLKPIGFIGVIYVYYCAI